MNLDYGVLLRDRRALISGGATEVGQAVAALFSAHGAKVAIIDEGAEAVEAALMRLDKIAPGVAGFSGDYACEESVSNLFSRAKAAVGSIDILVNAAGLYIAGTAEEITIADLWRMLDVNVLSAIRLTKLAVPDMLANFRGDIVNITADIGTVKARERTAAIAACAGAVNAFSRCVTMDYIRYHVRANCVAYPFDGLAGRKPLLGRPSPEDAANAALWYACDLSRFVIGDTIPVDGGSQYFVDSGGAHP